MYVKFEKHNCKNQSVETTNGLYASEAHKVRDVELIISF